MKSDKLNEYTVQLRSKNIFLQYADRYLDHNGNDLRSKFTKDDAARFESDFQVTQQMLDDELAIAKSKGIEFKKDLYEKDLKYIKAFTKAYIGRSLFGNEGSARAMLDVDNQFQKAKTLFPEAEEIAKNLSSLK